MAQLTEINDENFQREVLDSDKPYLLDMAADWCGPCKDIAPIVAQLAEQYAGRISFGAVDVDKSPRIPTQYSVRAVPTLLLIKDGQVIGQLTGLHTKERIAELIEKAL